MNVWVSVLPVRLVGEVAREAAVLGLLAPAQHRHVRAVLGVVVLHAVVEAVHVDGHGGQLLAAERGHLAGLGHARRQVAALETVLHGVEQQRVHVRQRRGVGVVHDRELAARVGLGGGLGGLGHQEADGDDDPALVTDERVDVRRVVALRGRLQVLHRDLARIGGCRLLHALPRRGVERPVVDAAGVRHHAAQELTRGRCRSGRAGLSRRRAGTARIRRAAAARRGEQARYGQHCAGRKGLLHWLPPVSRGTVAACSWAVAPRDLTLIRAGRDPIFTRASPRWPFPTLRAVMIQASGSSQVSPDVPGREGAEVPALHTLPNRNRAVSEAAEGRRADAGDSHLTCAVIVLWQK